MKPPRRNPVSIIPIASIPEIKPGDDLVAIVSDSILNEGLSLAEGDVLVLAQKIVSKAEGRIIRLQDVAPSPFALKLAAELNKDAELVEVILSESRRILKAERRGDKGMLIVETNHGIVLANAGVDASNVSGGDTVTLLPVDPDASAQRLRRGFNERFGADAAVIITDTVGRPWREGLVEIAIGCAGLKALRDFRGMKDAKGFEMSATVIAVADEIASAAGLAMGKNDAVPAVIVRGFEYERGGGGTKEIIRARENDIFR
ncbi:MAG: coenzyme F420-0:L-glutamate ligase [Deltaproteobacteria bacterium]